MKIALKDRLYYKQARNSVLVAFLLGFLFSIGQIMLDFKNEQREIDSTVLQVLNSSKESAAQAAYGLNNDLALKVVKGLFEYHPIFDAQIRDDFGRELASLKRPRNQNEYIWLASFIENDERTYAIPLYIDNGATIIGEMRVRVDAILVAQNFIKRAGLIIASGALRNCFLAIILTLIFYYSLTKPINMASDAVSRIDPSQPTNVKLTVPANHSDDEFGILLRKFNTLLEEFDATLEKRQRAEEQLRKSEETIRHLNSRLEDKVRQRTADLQATNEEMEAFSYSVSHDLRAPLRTISGFSSILEEEYGDKLDDQAKHYLSRVRAGTDKMESLINDLLKLSRSTRGELRLSEVNLSATAEEVIAEIRERDTDRVITIDITPGMKAWGDPRFIKVIMENILRNAWKYTSKVENPVITVGQHEGGLRPVYFVRDNGAGFDMAYAEKLFAPFQRLHSPKEFEGTGIGLATVQRIVKRHSGDIWAESSIGNGATFYFSLPYPQTQE